MAANLGVRPVRPEIPCVQRYNETIRMNLLEMSDMLEFKTDDRHRIFNILLRRIKYKLDFCCVPVWIINTLYRHPGQLNSEFETNLKQKEHHFLTTEDVDLKASTIDAVVNYPYYWVKKGENVLGDNNGWELWDENDVYLEKKKKDCRK